MAPTKSTSTVRRDHYAKSIRRALDRVNSEEFAQLSRSEVDDVIPMLEEKWLQFEKEHLDLMADPTLKENHEAFVQMFADVENDYLAIRRVARLRADAMQEEEAQQ